TDPASVYRAHAFEADKFARDWSIDLRPDLQSLRFAEYDAKEYRRVDVGVHRFCRSSRSRSVERIFHFAGENRLLRMDAKGRLGSEIRMRLSAWECGMILAIGRLRSVTIISSPASTERRCSER